MKCKRTDFYIGKNFNVEWGEKVFFNTQIFTAKIMKILFIVYFSHQHQKEKKRGRMGNGVLENNWRATETGEGEKTNSAKKEKLDSARHHFNSPFPCPQWKIQNFPTWKFYEEILTTLNICPSLYGSLLFNFMFHLVSPAEEWINRVPSSRSIIQIIKSLFVVWNKLLLLCVLLQKTHRHIHHRVFLFISHFSILQNSQREKNWTNSVEKIVSTKRLKRKIVKIRF